MSTQVVALFVHQRVNKAYKGLEYWVLGSSLMAIGFILMPLIRVQQLAIIARIANPLLILGNLFLYIGVKKFFNKKINILAPVLIFIIFNLFYYYFMLMDNNLSARSIVISVTIAIISFMITKELFFNRKVHNFSAAKFTATIMFLYGGYHTIRILQISTMPSLSSYADQSNDLIVLYFTSIIISNLWTFGLIAMINQRLNIENKLEKEKLQLIFNTNIDAQLITRLEDGLIVDVNDEFMILSGYTKAEIMDGTSNVKDFWIKSEDRKLFRAQLKDKGFCENLEFVFRRKDNSQFEGTISAKIINIDAVNHIISVVRDISERKRTENALIESEEKYRSILNASPDDITITDLTGKILIISPVAKKMFGYEADFNNFVGMQLLDFIVPEDVERAKVQIQKLHLEGVRSSNEYRGLRQDKSVFDIEVNSGFVYNAKGQPDKMVFIVRDVTKRKLVESQIQKLIQQLEVEKNMAVINSITDSLTGLYNRRYFDKTLKTEYHRLMRSGTALSLIMLDIDHFKKFNDTYGHMAGDKCLQMIASTLKMSVERAADMVSRYGGEEFIAILPETNENGARILAERIRNAIENLAVSHDSSETSKYLTVSVGVVTVYPMDGLSPDSILKLVDDALYDAKRNGRNCCSYITNKKEV